MHSSTDVGFMRAVYTPPHATFPNVAAYINITASQPAISFEYHAKDPFVEDDRTKGFPPANNLTFESAWSMLNEKAPQVGVTQVTWRRPVNPCVSEDLFQFNLDRTVPAHGGVISIGIESKKVCYGFVTQVVQIPYCEKSHPPDCISDVEARQYAPISV